jgi:predicted NAD-dependent protein-ADP-ribosyltransferase YbiA (DUF1768 family)
MSEDPSLAVRPEWPSIKEAVMKQSLREKLLQNRTILEILFEAGDEELLHFSKQDQYYREMTSVAEKTDSAFN